MLFSPIFRGRIRFSVLCLLKVRNNSNLAPSQRCFSFEFRRKTIHWLFCRSICIVSMQFLMICCFYVSFFYFVQMSQIIVKFNSSKTIYRLLFNILGRIYKRSVLSLLEILQKKYEKYIQNLTTMQLFFWSITVFRAWIFKQTIRDMNNNEIYI